MPQLDIASFASQVTWLFLTLIVFYLISVRFLLPKLVTALKVRQRSTAEVTPADREISDAREESNVVFESAFTKSRENALNYIRKELEVIASKDAQAQQKFVDAERMMLEAIIRTRLDQLSS